MLSKPTCNFLANSFSLDKRFYFISPLIHERNISCPPLFPFPAALTS